MLVGLLLEQNLCILRVIRDEKDLSSYEELIQKKRIIPVYRGIIQVRALIVVVLAILNNAQAAR